MTSNLDGSLKLPPIEPNKEIEDKNKVLSYAKVRLDAAKKKEMNKPTESSKSRPQSSPQSPVSSWSNHPNSPRALSLRVMDSFAEKLLVNKGTDTDFDDLSEESTTEHEVNEEEPVTEQELRKHIGQIKVLIGHGVHYKDSSLIDTGLELIGRTLHTLIEKRDITPELANEILEELADDPKIGTPVLERLEAKDGEFPSLTSLISKLENLQSHLNVASDGLDEICEDFFSQSPVSLNQFSVFLDRLTATIKTPWLLEKAIQVNISEISSMLNEGKIDLKTAEDMIKKLYDNPSTKKCLESYPSHFSAEFRSLDASKCKAIVAQAITSPAKFDKFLSHTANSVRSPYVLDAIIQTSLSKIGDNLSQNLITDANAKSLLSVLYTNPRFYSRLEDNTGRFIVDNRLVKAINAGHTSEQERRQLDQDINEALDDALKQAEKKEANISEFMNDNMDEINTFFATHKSAQTSAIDELESLLNEELKNLHELDSEIELIDLHEHLLSSIEQETAEKLQGMFDEMLHEGEDIHTVAMHNAAAESASVSDLDEMMKKMSMEVSDKKNDEIDDILNDIPSDKTRNMQKNDYSEFENINIDDFLSGLDSDVGKAFEDFNKPH